MNGRSWEDRARERRERRETGRTSLRVTRATHAKIQRLLGAIPPFEVTGVDELLDELVSAELRRRGVAAPADPAQMDLTDPGATDAA